MGSDMRILLKRVYEEAEQDDGFRVLSERLWPRGLSKEKARVDQWVKDLAPSPELRRWYAHDETKWPEFQARYRAELDAAPGLDSWIESLRAHEVVTLVFASKGDKNSSVVLREVIFEREESEGRCRPS